MLTTNLTDVRRRLGLKSASRGPNPGVILAVAGAAAVAAIAALAFDETTVRRRMKYVNDKVVRLRVRGGRRLERLTQAGASEAYGLRQKLAHLGGDQSPPTNDADLANKVRSEAFRGAEIPSGRVNVRAENGVIVLSGELERPDEIREVEERVRRIDGVSEVRSLLHLVNAPAPERAHRVS